MFSTCSGRRGSPRATGRSPSHGRQPCSRHGVARAQQDRQVLPGLVRVCPQPGGTRQPCCLKFPAAFSFSECAVISVASTSIVNRPGAPRQLPELSRSRACACAERSPSSIPGVDAIRSTIRNAVESDATDPNSAPCSRTAPRSDTHSPPSASITARSQITRPGSWPRRRCLITPRRLDSARVSPSLSATWPNNALPACETRPAPSAVTSTVTERPSRITFTVNLQARDPGLRQSQESLLRRTFPRPRSPRGRGSYCTIRASALQSAPDCRSSIAEPRSCEPVRSSAQRSPARNLHTFDTDLYGSITTADLG